MADNYGVFRCPCCGGQALTIVERDGWQHVVRIECSECRIATPNLIYRPTQRSECSNVMDAGYTPSLTAAREMVREIWNKRVYEEIA